MSSPVSRQEPQDGADINVFDDFLLKERAALNLPCAKADLADPCGSALAISGGGIRSASFALGVIQTFLNEKPGDAGAESADTCFDRFDYLSTVSGGGYIGSTVTWLKYQFGKEWRRFLGDRDLGARSAEFRADKTAGVQGSNFDPLHGRAREPKPGDLYHYTVAPRLKHVNPPDPCDRETELLENQAEKVT